MDGWIMMSKIMRNNLTPSEEEHEMWLLFCLFGSVKTFFSSLYSVFV